MPLLIVNCRKMKILKENSKLNIFKIKFFKKYLHEKSQNIVYHVNVLQKKNSRLISKKSHRYKFIVLKWFAQYICSELLVVMIKENQNFFINKRILDEIKDNLKFSNNFLLNLRKSKSEGEKFVIKYNRKFNYQNVLSINNNAFSKNNTLTCIFKKIRCFESKFRLNKRSRLSIHIIKYFTELKKISRNSFRIFLIVRNLKTMYSRIKKILKSKL